MAESSYTTTTKIDRKMCWMPQHKAEPTELDSSTIYLAESGGRVAWPSGVQG